MGGWCLVNAWTGEIFRIVYLMERMDHGICPSLVVTSLHQWKWLRDWKTRSLAQIIDEVIRQHETSFSVPYTP